MTMLPVDIETRLLTFLRDGGTGKFILNIKCGEVRSAELQEHIAALDRQEARVVGSQ